jgi:hypothetical protein
MDIMDDIDELKLEGFYSSSELLMDYLDEILIAEFYSSSELIIDGPE